MQETQQKSFTLNVYEKECRRLWKDISLRIHQPHEFDINADVLKINYSLESSDTKFVIKDFRIFERDSYRFFDTITIRIDDTNISVTPIELAKLVFLLSSQDQKPSSNYVSAIFNGVCTFFSLMKDRAIDARLNNSDYQEYYEMIFSFSPMSDGLVKRLSVPSFTAAIPSLNLSGSIKAYRYLNVPFTFENLSKDSEKKLISQVCLDVMGLTFYDYSKGGSFNFLGLEVGKHYVDHCANVFEDNFQLALALRETYSNAEMVLENATLPIANSNKAAIIGRALTGETIDTIIVATGMSRSIIEEPYQLLLKEFRTQYENCSAISTINKFKVITEIIEHADLPERFDTYEFVRSILIAEFINDWNKPSESIFSEYAASLRIDSYYIDEKNVFKCTYKDFIRICRESVKRNAVTLPKSSKKLTKFIKDQFVSATFMGDRALVGVQTLNRFFSGVESAGNTLFVALTGWRRSEYGFPISRVNATINTEILDNLFTPWRFNVNWKVKKTHGEADIDREITSYSYQIAYMASLVNSSGIDKPALYNRRSKTSNGASNEFRSEIYIISRIDFLWLDFIQNYILFDNLDVNEYPGFNELKCSLREAVPVYEFLKKANKLKLFKQYRDGCLDEKATTLLDEKLSKESKEFIKDKHNKIITSTVITLSRELMGDLTYPTPHAFRHVWAEAVLMRYRGDVGKVIRANFKHMDYSFFIAYLRNKEMKAVYRIAERTIINQIVRHHIRSANDKYHNFAGGFQRFVSRVARMTKVVTVKEQEELVNFIGPKVTSIKGNRWATCMLRSGNQHRAKCAEDGIPQRRNASPEFCLGCMHADISEMNFKGIVISIKDDVMACRNENLPEFIKAPYAKVLKLALARIKELRKNSGKTIFDKYIDHLEESIKMATTISLAGNRKND